MHFPVSRTKLYFVQKKNVFRLLMGYINKLKEKKKRSVCVGEIFGGGGGGDFFVNSKTVHLGI